ncbi:MAG: acetyl/propionyl/methylcrotonyl-CoA carboxylase subunit alpha [Acetobacteraceae bacterium]
MFRKILIANRGEIACRVIATARRLGIATVAIYSEADARAQHVSLADEAWPIGPGPARESYLVGERILEVARRTGAEAIHPGYGFLSENAGFAEACAAADIVFIGPPAAAIRAMGSKSAAKTLMERAGVPLVPGYHGEAQDLPTLAAAAERIGYPVLIKASAGGGGKGMRIVERSGELEAAVGGAKREALASFGDDQVLVEKYLTRPRHIEIQVFADTHGQAVSLFERDCSIQRRHQKVLEEAPAPGMEPERRRRMSEAALAAARAVGYVGAGTVEFIAEPGQFWFMEMNTRLQVEHPVTEMITGLDLVEWQLRVAAGERLPLAQDEIAIRGHSIEARIYAEDPERDYLPSIGTLVHLRSPVETPEVRVDTGVRQGDAITPFYDPMIAKLIVWGTDRDAAVLRLAAALAAYEIVGVTTNLGLLQAIAGSSAFLAADLDTGFIGRHIHAEPAADAPEPAVLAAAALAILDGRRIFAPTDPWDLADSFRLNGEGDQEVLLQTGETVATIRAVYLDRGAYRLLLADNSMVARVETDGISLDGVTHRTHVVRQGAELTVIHRGRNHLFELVDPLVPAGAQGAGDDRVVAPIPARITHVLVQAGDMVNKGAALIVLEAMKMEITLTAPRDATVEVIRYIVGDMVEEGTELIHFAETAEA